MSEKTISYQIGRLWGSMSSTARIFLCLAVAAVVVGAGAYSDASDRERLRQAEAVKKAQDELAASHRAAAVKARISMCQTNVSVLVEKAKALAASGNAKGAHEAMNACNGSLENKEALALAKKYLNTYSDQVAKNAARQEAAERAKKKKEGVRIGMSRDDALASMWGKPASINTTTTANGTREQWVYGNGNYLYFVNGILTSIQN